MTVKQVALQLGVSERRVRAMIHAGQIKRARQIYPGGSWIIYGPLNLERMGPSKRWFRGRWQEKGNGA